MNISLYHFIFGILIVTVLKIRLKIPWQSHKPLVLQGFSTKSACFSTFSYICNIFSCHWKSLSLLHPSYTSFVPLTHAYFSFLAYQVLFLKLIGLMLKAAEDDDQTNQRQNPQPLIDEGSTVLASAEKSEQSLNLP